ncbi:unnamed protein product [Calicophoron daubneyi]|uniref:Lsm14-like N-terminal domain-containing protein n=1 Tax=Calicophoron daubneyi TaxID=300641 RepID=A0AAV2TJ48_CALDB
MMSGGDIQPSRLSLGTKVSLITGAQYRYEGVVAAINSIEGTLTLQNVRFWGTENRTPPNGSTQYPENKAPAVGSVFDSITFWMSSIVRLWTTEEPNVEHNDLGDKGVVKVANAVDVGRGRGRRQRNWWSSAGDQPRPVRSSPTNLGAPMSRYMNPPTQPLLTTQPRMLVSYPRRGRNLGAIPRQASYVPVVPIMTGPGGMRRSAYGPNMRGTPFRLLATPIPPGTMGPGTRLNGRKMNHPVRRISVNPDDRRYSQNVVNPGGGVFVYLPPEMAAAYQSRGINLVPARQAMGRRRITERRGTPRRSESIEPEVDCTTPYDFETANAELEAELAKITINPDGVATTTTPRQSAGAEASSAPTAATSTGDGVSTDPRSPHSGGVTASAVSGNGASGDSSLGAVTSTVNSVIGEATGTASSAGLEGSGPLAKGEYYDREKCFFDQISRSEGGPRGPYPIRGVYNQSSYVHMNVNGGGAPNGMSNYGSSVGGINSAAAARRERQLNMETFGAMAVRTVFAPRRRPAGSGPREFLISASA